MLSDMSKRVWIVNYYTGSPASQLNPRYLELAKRFMAAGYEVITINSSQREGLAAGDFKGHGPFLDRSYEGGYRFIHVKVPAYKGNGLARMYSIWRFACLLGKLTRRMPRPDVILHNIHPPFDYPVVRLARKYKVKYIAEAWDLWPEYFVTFGLVSRSNPLMKVAYAIEKKYYQAADDIVFTFLGAFDYLRRQGWMKDQGGPVDPVHLHYINNGIDLAAFDRNKTAWPRPDPDLNEEGIRRIIYLGSVNKANQVQRLVDAADLLQDDPSFRIFIYGDGAYREGLQKYVREKNIRNVVFKEKHIPLEECAWVVSQATVNVMCYEKGFGQWGVSSGKLFQYLAAGKPILCNVDIAYDNVIEEERLGVARDISSAMEMAQELRRLAGLPGPEYAAMCARVRKAAARFDYDVLAQREQALLD